jgi:hypothetical protein
MTLYTILPANLMPDTAEWCGLTVSTLILVSMHDKLNNRQGKLMSGITMDTLLAFAGVLRYPRILISDRDRASAHRWGQESKHGRCAGWHQGD